MSQKFSNFVCWKLDRIGAVINKEALSVNRADFLATHVPMREIVYERAPRELANTSEENLLAELQHQADTNQHTFVVIKGVPGTGKSHLIRWLKERYAADHPNSAVLLIERANTSLRGTLQQIISSGLFNRDQLPDSLQRLHEAVIELTADALADNLLDQIKTAILEVEYPDLPNRIKSEKIYRFLLDVVIREQLKSPDGPIERISAFLTQGRDDNTGVDETPGFEPSDFDFTPDLLRKLNGYPEAKKVAEDLQYKPELRDALARYLNYLLRRYAISRATRLSAQDLREMFNDLRRHLRSLGLELALFIEDITAFTGIDEGLLDVLITQHTGEANSDFCRLTSVIGVTDAYFSDYMPDNFKQRITHQLTLSGSDIRSGSALIQDESVRLEFAARYMNAMRLTHAQLDQWNRSGGTASALPVACDHCPVRESCFSAFGYAEIGEETERLQIGLYPFNKRSVDTLFRSLRESYPRTPRTFLFDLLGYILQSHSTKIESGDFPPPETDLAPAVQAPSFNPPTHRQIVEKQGGLAAKRLMSLLLYWGDRSANRTKEGLGTLPNAVFQAFSVKVVEGVEGASPINVLPQTSPKIRPYTPSPVISSDEGNRYTRLIDTWMSTGKLSAYDKFAEWMADLVRSFIDWQAYGISLEQVKEYVTQGRFEIEGQTGTSQRKHRLFFSRTPELRYVLQALADLNTDPGSLSADQYGEHLTTLSSWLRSEEQRIVEFVREPSGLKPPPDYLVDLLIRNVVLLACLSGELTPTEDFVDLYHQVISSCATNRKWEERMTEIKDLYPASWRTLTRDVNIQDAVSICRKSVLQLLNRPQGRSDAIRYIDAGKMLRVLTEFSATDWTIPELEFTPDTNDPTWTAAVTVNLVLRKGLQPAVDACYSDLSKLNSELVAALGDSSPKQMIESMHSALKGLRTVGITYNSRLDGLFDKDRPARLTATNFKTLQERSNAALQKETLRERAIYAGGSWLNDFRSLHDLVSTLKSFEQEMRKKLETLAKRLEELRQKSDGAQNFQQAQSHLTEITLLLEAATSDSYDQ